MRRYLLAVALLLAASPAAAQFACVGDPPLRSEKGPVRQPGYNLTTEEFDSWLSQVRYMCDTGAAADPFAQYLLPAEADLLYSALGHAHAFAAITGQVGDTQIADGAVDGGTGGEIADGSITGDDLAADAVALGTKTSGNYVASVATTAPLAGGAAGSEGGALTLSLSQHAGTDVTADLEEEAHAAEHSLGGGDAITATDLASGCTDVQVLGGTAAGTGVECQADDDAPDAGDFGAATDLDANGAVETDSVALGTDTTGNYAGSSSEGGPATTATALAANGANCSAGNYPLGVDASGNAESCTAAGGGSGDVVGPASATDNAAAVYDSTTGKLLKDSRVLIPTQADAASVEAIKMQGPNRATSANNDGARIGLYLENNAGNQYEYGRIRVTRRADNIGEVAISADYGGVIDTLTGSSPAIIVGNNTASQSVRAYVGASSTNAFTVDDNSGARFQVFGTVVSIAAIPVRMGVGTSTSAPNFYRTADTDTGFGWGGTDDFRLFAGGDDVLIVARASSLNTATVNGGLDLDSAAGGTKPTCDSTKRGVLWFTEGGAGVADKTEQCMKGTADTYSWVAVVTAP